jgi:C1A family cysteine protease
MIVSYLRCSAVLAILGLWLVLLVSVQAVPCGALAQEPQVAPSRPATLDDVQSSMGFIPPPGDLSHITATMPDGPLPILSRFDWREAGMITPVKNQGPCGSCYAFAAVASFESRLLIDGGGTFDFSENNVKECEWYGSSCWGGNYWRVASFLTASGTVLEACDPYVASDVACNSSCPYRKTLLEWCVISADVIPPVNTLKSYIQTYGPVYTTMYAGNEDAWHTEFQGYDGTYTLHHVGSEPPNHAVLIVGWDDDLTHAGGQGAWIVKNSWGTFWGGTCGYGSEGGYFTIAYGSAQMGTFASYASQWQDYDPNGVMLLLDEGGYTGSVGYGNATCWGLCKFIPAEDIEIERVEFWSLDATPDVDVYIYDDFNGSSPSNLLGSQLNSSFDNAGYHSVELSSPIEVSSGEDIYAVVKLRDASYIYPMSFDQYGPKSAGCCYISPTGASFSEWSGGDLGIRLRGAEQASCGGIIEEPAIQTVLDVPADGGGYVNLTWKRSIYDQEESTPQVARYKVWRRRVETLPALLAAPQVGGPFEHGETGPAWELVGTVAATGGCCYELETSTHCDSSASDTCWTYYCVTAHTGQVGERFDSSVDRGYSVNNQGMLRSPGAGELQAPEEGGATMDASYLAVPLPNPGEGDFEIRFGLAHADWVQVEVYDVAGRRITVLTESFMEAGSHRVTWTPYAASGTRFSPGLYFVRMVTTSEAHTAKLMLLDR